ncbi:hypothetical protein BN131_2155 [Cronobacter malonaticus 681]|nr:hypothetical protein BN131_2155 [Cronobacter malonaticus 681]
MRLRCFLNLLLMQKTDPAVFLLQISLPAMREYLYRKT